MFKTIKTMFKGYSALKQGVIIVVFLMSLVAAFSTWLAVHDYHKKQVVLEDITAKEKVIKNEDEKRVEDASAVVGAVRDCIKLGSVYGTDECTQRQEPLENNIQTTPFTQTENPYGVGPSDAVMDRLPLSMGSLFQGNTEDESLCYDQPVMDEFGLPNYIYDGGEWVHEMIEVCPE